MAWSEQWTYVVDGVNLNDHVNYVCFIPELQTIPQSRVILAPIDGDFPVFVRAQPMEATYTFLIAVKGAKSAVLWDTLSYQLLSLFTPGVLHTAQVQVRGMTGPRSFQFAVESAQADYRTRTMAVQTVAPKPFVYD